MRSLWQFTRKWDIDLVILVFGAIMVIMTVLFSGTAFLGPALPR